MGARGCNVTKGKADKWRAKQKILWLNEWKRLPFQKRDRQRLREIKRGNVHRERERAKGSQGREKRERLTEKEK